MGDVFATLATSFCTGFPVGIKGMLKCLNENFGLIPTLTTELSALEKIDSSISTSELFPETCPYNEYRKDMNSKDGGVMLLIHTDVSHMPITALGNDSETVWVKVFTNKPSHFVASWYQPPGRNLAELTSKIDLLRSQLQKIKCMHKGYKPPLSPCSGGLQLQLQHCLAR